MSENFYQKGSFLCLDGPARKAGFEPSNMKVCFTCTDIDLLRKLLVKVSENQTCYWVKMSIDPKDGMYLGRCFFTTKDDAAKLWAKYKHHPRFMVTLQDDDFALKFREHVTSWKDKPRDMLD
jgi:hypothetical protein